MAESIFAFNLRTRFLPDIWFQQNHKGHYGAWFKPKKSTHQWTKALSPKWVFSQKCSSVNFLPLRHPNFMRSFRKILWAILEKMCLPTDILTYWQWWNHRTPFSQKVEVQKVALIPLIVECELKLIKFYCAFLFVEKYCFSIYD